MKKYPSPYEEEVLTVLWLIAGFLAWNGGLFWIAILLFLKSSADLIFCFTASIRQIVADHKEETK